MYCSKAVRRKAGPHFSTLQELQIGNPGSNAKYAKLRIKLRSNECLGVVCTAAIWLLNVSFLYRKKYSLEYYLKIAEQLVDHGVHTLAIKDMAGVLKPRAASILIGALRESFPNVPIHVHTHDTAGTGVATQLAAANAGADIIDCCIDSMAGQIAPCSKIGFGKFPLCFAAGRLYSLNSSAKNPLHT